MNRTPQPTPAIFEHTEAFARLMDTRDPLRRFRDAFHFPVHEGRPCIYLCGNSLGLQPKNAAQYVQEELEDWARLGVEGHFRARHPWMPYHEYLTMPMSELVGASPSEVVVMNSLSVNIHLLMVSFYRPGQKRYKILVEHDIFPSDRYAVESQLRFHGFDPADALVVWAPEEGEHTLSMTGYHKCMEEHGAELALVFLGGVNYYTGQAFDLAKITEIAHQYGALAGFDLAHAAGNVALQLHDADADFAAWCSYKYLNAGPGSLSGVFIHERHAMNPDIPRFAGWWGHNKNTRFGMRDPFDPIPGAEGWQLSNPPILPMAAMRASLELFSQAGMEALVKKSRHLTGFLEFLLQKNVPEDTIEIITPQQEASRGCQLSLLTRTGGEAIFRALSASGVIADWREPNVIRVAPVPLYNSFEDIWQFVEILNNAISDRNNS